MVASYTTNGRITKQGTNDNPNTWGTVTNNQVIELFEEMISGVIEIDITGSSNVTLTTNNGSTDQARHAVLELTGTLGDDIELIVPAVEKKYLIRAAWTGDYTVTVKITGSSTEVVLRNATKKIVYTNGSDIYDMIEQGILVSPDDTNAGTLEDKLSLVAPLVSQTLNDGGNESVEVSLDSNIILSGLGLQAGQSFRPGSGFSTDITIPVGAYSAIDGSFMNVTAEVTKGLDSTWVEGDGNGGLDTGSVLGTTTYFVFVINNPTTGVTDGLFSTSRTSPTLPAGFTKYRMIGFVKTDVSSLISERGIVWSSFGTFSAPTAWLMADVSSSNSVSSVYFVIGTDPSATGSKLVITSNGGIRADDDLTAFASD